MNEFGRVVSVGSTQHQNAGHVCSPGSTCAVPGIYDEGFCKGMQKWKNGYSNPFNELLLDSLQFSVFILPSRGLLET